MAQKQVEIEGIGLVTLSKRKGMKQLRLTISTSGVPQITMPHWVPYGSGIAFAKQRAAWIIKHSKQPRLLGFGDIIGKDQVLKFENGPFAKIKTRIKTGVVSVQLPYDVDQQSVAAQEAAQKAVARALKKQTETLLLPRLQDLSLLHDLPYSSASVKRLRSRWGSCSNTKHITLSSYLVQLPWDLIDYVLLHELTHTKIMAHGSVFWNELANYVEDLPAKRKSIRAYKANILPG